MIHTEYIYKYQILYEDIWLNACADFKYALKIKTNTGATERWEERVWKDRIKDASTKKM